MPFDGISKSQNRRQSKYTREQYQANSIDVLTMSNNLGNLATHPFMMVLFISLIVQPLLTDAAPVVHSSKVSETPVVGSDTKINMSNDTAIPIPATKSPSFFSSVDHENDKPIPIIGSTKKTKKQRRHKTKKPRRKNKKPRQPKVPVVTKPRDKKPPEKPSELLKDAVRSVTIVQLAVGNMHDVSNTLSIVQLSNADLDKIHNAMIAAGKEAHLTQDLKELKIIVVPEPYMKELTGVSEFDAGFVPEKNAIYINDYLLAGDSKIKQKHLTTVFANEFSHHQMYLSNNKKSATPKQDAVEYVYPWSNPFEKSRLKSSYDLFLDRVEDYKRLVEKQSNSALLDDEAQRLEAYDAAMYTYITPRHGRDSYNAMQVFIEVDTVNNKAALFRDFDNLLPSLHTPEKRLSYQRENFFREFKMQALSYQHSLSKLYAGADEGKMYADTLSDFESLSPKMRMVFGPELCGYLDRYHDSQDHCERLFWPRPTVGTV